MVCYPAGQAALYTAEGPPRSAGQATMATPAQYSGHTVEVFLGFISQSGSKVSHSAYLGAVLVP